MTTEPLTWPDEVDDIIRGDLTVAVAYNTPAGGTVVASVSPVGLADREAGVVGFTTSLGFPRKLERILRDPRVSLAYHTRLHGYADHPPYVLAQGRATLDMQPTPERLAALAAAAERFLGPVKQGRIWDWVLREYLQERVFVDVTVERIAVWPDLTTHGSPDVTGPALPPAPDPQRPPKNGTAPRVPVGTQLRKIADMPHRLLGYQGADGFPVVIPVRVTGHDETGLQLEAAPGLLPPGGRRAGLLAHAFNAQCAGLGMRTFTGWLTVTGERALYAPHTAKALAAPANKTLIALGNGLMAKHGLRRARRDGTADRLRALATGGAAPAR
ncbi:hypothetical protein [Streptomyces sp. FZ201]|uniref:hypothetical protein n=1 Tax=Streptomyces sp. FZ201 TaxID=3057122 RepID=UPI0021BFD0EF|nr:hypothetical protein [Streptomyces sp. FZ201]